MGEGRALSATTDKAAFFTRHGRCHGAPPALTALGAALFQNNPGIQGHNSIQSPVPPKQLPPGRTVDTALPGFVVTAWRGRGRWASPSVQVPTVLTHGDTHAAGAPPPWSMGCPEVNAAPQTL